MNSARKQKLGIVLSIVLGAAIAVSLILVAFDQGLNVFFTPTEIADGKVNAHQNIRIGGMVKVGSLVKEGLAGTRIEFVATDTNIDIPVVYEGVLPDIFREGQGVVAEGYVDEHGVFQARQIMAKHDENYMSPEVQAAMEAGRHKQAQGSLTP
ncbi:MAG: cytochrome c maturation protein CcmE [Pseudomonadales bacterium]|jgi:cytochrome c-type biogenesis protein CcmE|nr:cytochrome c maturation protein CcmE [Pseudomonadales bacterium]